MSKGYPRNKPTDAGSDVLSNNNLMTVVGIEGIAFDTNPYAAPTDGQVPTYGASRRTLTWQTPPGGSSAALLNKLVVDRQGLVMTDRSGAVIYSQ